MAIMSLDLGDDKNICLQYQCWYEQNNEILRHVVNNMTIGSALN